MRAVPSVGAMKAYMETHVGHEHGDPRKAAAAIIEITTIAAPPLRLALGNDAMAMLRHSLKTSSDELERWANLTKSTDFNDLTVSDTDHAAIKLVNA